MVLESLDLPEKKPHGSDLGTARRGRTDPTGPVLWSDTNPFADLLYFRLKCIDVIYNIKPYQKFEAPHSMDVRTLTLGVLSQGDATGYEIKKAFEAHYSHFFEASYGSIYPALNRLTGEGLVACTEHAQAKRPDKKVYTITPAGRLAFLDDLMEPPGRDRVRSEFLATMLFGQLLPPRHLEQVIDDRLALYREWIAQMEAKSPNDAAAGPAFVLGFGLAVYRAAADYVDENRHLVEGEALLSHAGVGR